jgi:hypothetical protein
MKIDLEAPIIPGRTAGNILLGTDVMSVIEDSDIQFEKDDKIEVIIYRSPNITLYTNREGTIHQIMVHGNYLGKINEKVGLGTTYEDLQHYLGPVEEDDNDSMIVKKFPGFFFEHNPEAPFPLTHIGVYTPESQ